MSWLFRWLSATERWRIALWAVCLSGLACALGGSGAWIASHPAGARADASNAKVLRVATSETAPVAREFDLAQQCAALGDPQPVARMATRIDPLGPTTNTGVSLPQKSGVTVWLQEGPREPGGVNFREMSPVGAQPLGPQPNARAVDTLSQAASAPSAARSGDVRPTAPVVRRTPDRPESELAAAAQASAAPVATLRLPGRALEENQRGSLQISALTDRAAEPAPPVTGTKPTASDTVAAPPAARMSIPGSEVRATVPSPPAPQPSKVTEVFVADAPARSYSPTQPAAPPGAATPMPTASVARPNPTPIAATPSAPATLQLPGGVQHAIPVEPRAKTIEESSVGLLDRMLDRPPAAKNPNDDGPPPGTRPPVVPLGAGRVQSQPRRAPPPRDAAASQTGLPPPPKSMAYISPAEATRHMAIISKRAQEHIDYGFDLAERGALYSAEVEFSQSLLLVAQALDAHYRTQFHSRAVAAGLTALREADDFVPRGGQPIGGLDEILASHKTPVCKSNADELPPLVAMQRYYAYAQQQLMLAAGSDPSAAMALYGLGRLQTALAAEHGVKKMTAGPKAMALYQATIGVDPQNYLAANELGVMLARYGQLREAEVALRRSVQIAPRPENWQNLASVYERLGDPRAAEHARAQHQLALASGTRPGRETNADRPPLKFVDNETFIKQSGSGMADDAVARDKSDGKTAGGAPGTPESKSQFGWIGDKVSAGMARVVGPSKPEATQVR